METGLGYQVLKNNNYAILFTGYDENIGYGHYVRSQSLYKLLKKKKLQIFILTNIKLNKDLQSIFQKYPTPKFIIIDTPTISNKILINYKNASKFIVFDWFKKFVPDYNISIYEHSKIEYSKKKFVGFDYVNIRPEIINLPIKNKKKEKKFLIVIGGGDIKNQGLKIAKIMDQKGFSVSLMKGPLCKYNDLFLKKSNLKYHENAKNFPKILNSYNNIITNGGTCLFESIYLNKNVYVLPQTIKEKNIAQYFYNKKLILGYGYMNISNFNFSKFNILNKNNKLVDGKGLERVGNIISKIMSE